MTEELNQRALEIFNHIVDEYIKTGEPVGSRTLSKRINSSLSPATIRNVMADLEHLGLLYSPHTSAGRLPTEAGLRFFANGLLELGDLSPEDEQGLRQQLEIHGDNFEDILNKVTTKLSDLSKCAGLVLSPRYDLPLRHIEFVQVNTNKALVIIVNEGGNVENRIITIPEGIPYDIMSNATAYLNNRITGCTLNEARDLIYSELRHERHQLDALTSKVIAAGIAEPVTDSNLATATLIIKGHAHLLSDVQEREDITHLQRLFTALEAKDSIMQLIDASLNAEGVQIFIGADNQLFSFSGCSMIVAPYTDSRRKVIGAIGVIGPKRLNYAKIIPMVDYTAKIISKMMAESNPPE